MVHFCMSLGSFWGSRFYLCGIPSAEMLHDMLCVILVTFVWEGILACFLGTKLDQTNLIVSLSIFEDSHAKQLK
jgi:hypothetical protein